MNAARTPDEVVGALADAFTAATGWAPRPVSAGRWKIRCPVHPPDRTPSGWLKAGDRRLLIGCRHDDDQAAVEAAALDALGMTTADLFYEPPRNPGQHRGHPPRRATPPVVRSTPPMGKSSPVTGAECPRRLHARGWYTLANASAVFVYRDADGREVLRKARYRDDPTPGAKHDRQFRPDEHGIWEPARSGVAYPPPPLFRLPELLAGIADNRVVFLCEGESDAEALAGRGIVATTTANGAGHWEARYVEPFRGADVVVAADRDPVGIDRAIRCVEALLPVAHSVEMVFPTLGSDIREHLDNGGTTGNVRYLDPPPKPWQPDDELSALLADGLR